MDGGGSNCIEKSLWNGQRKVNIRRSTKEKEGRFLVGDLFVVVALRLLSLLLMNSAAIMT
jgi:hypothetical protein